MPTTWEAIVDLLAFLPWAVIGLVFLVGAPYYELRAWWRGRRNTIVLTCLTPRCVECARKVALLEPFTANAVQQVRCDGCGVFLQARRDGDLWQICTVAEAKRQRTAPLPAALPLRSRIARVIFEPRPGVEPGEAALLEDAQ